MARKHIFHPQLAISWPQFIIGTFIAAIILGVGWQIGATIVNHWFKKYEHNNSVLENL